MSDPILETNDALHSGISEIISGISSLNMYPEPIPGAEGYISRTDENVKHSIEHFRAAIQLLNRAYQEREGLKREIFLLECERNQLLAETSTRRTYVVEGSGRFPIDMLLYDESFPASKQDSELILRTHRRKIMLASYKICCEYSVSHWNRLNWSVQPF